MNIDYNIEHKRYAHSFIVTVNTPFGDEDYLLLVDDVSNEAEISTNRGSVKFASYSLTDSSFSADFKIDTPMTASVSLEFGKDSNSDLFFGTVSVGEFVKTTLTAKRHQ